MDSKKSNKIRDIVRLQQILKKWKKLANAPKNNTLPSTSTTAAATTLINSNNNNNNSRNRNNGKSINKFLKKTLSFSDLSNSSSSASIWAVDANNVAPPKGFLAICVGKELKRYVIPTEYLSHQAFVVLLREAEEEFGFQQEGVLKIPCEVAVFEKVLNMVHDKKEVLFFPHEELPTNSDCCELTHSPHPQLCR